MSLWIFTKLICGCGQGIETLSMEIFEGNSEIVYLKGVDFETNVHL